MFKSECRIWKVTLLILTILTIGLIIACAILSVKAYEHNTCPVITPTCPDCILCKPQVETLNIKKFRKFKIKPYYLEKAFLKCDNTFDEKGDVFYYDTNTKKIKSAKLELQNEGINTWQIMENNGKILTYPKEGNEFQMMYIYEDKIMKCDNQKNISSKFSTFEFIFL